MKRKHFTLLSLCAVAFTLLAAPVWAAVGRATADFSNARPDKNETAWGRLTADSLRATAGSDVALINAGGLRDGTLKAGPVEQAQIDALLNFGDDEVVTLTITGAQLRSALERAVQEYPTGDVAFLHGAGLNVAFSGQGRGQRVQSVRVNGREVGPGDAIRVAMPLSLANDVYYRVWNGQNAQRTGTKVRQSIANYIQNQRQVAPDPNPRIAPR